MSLKISSILVVGVFLISCSSSFRSVRKDFENNHLSSDPDAYNPAIRNYELLIALSVTHSKGGQIYAYTFRRRNAMLYRYNLQFSNPVLQDSSECDPALAREILDSVYRNNLHRQRFIQEDDNITICQWQPGDTLKCGYKHDGNTYSLSIQTPGKSIVMQQFYEPYYFEKCCPGKIFERSRFLNGIAPITRSKL